MNAVSRPLSRRGIFYRLVKHSLERNKRCPESIRDAPGRRAIGIEFGKPLFVHGAAAQDERLADDQLYFGAFFSLRQDWAVTESDGDDSFTGLCSITGRFLLS